MCKVCGHVVGTSDSTTNFWLLVWIGNCFTHNWSADVKIIGGQSEDSFSLSGYISSIHVRIIEQLQPRVVERFEYIG